MSTDKPDINSIKPLFVCNKCRSECKNGIDSVGPYGPDNCPIAYPTRKFNIGCLANFCDWPCELKSDSTDLTLELAIRVIKGLVIECNKLLIREPI